MFCGAQSISYENADPLMAVRGDMQYIVDDEGRRFLDTRNNVGHVGWQHPDVVGAVQRQAAMLNCNQRYLHPNRVLLAERLTATMPPELCVCFLVNSGSEANDLAIRLAKAHTGGSDFIVVDHG
jgi:4-aminobutyrate aminotransferase-like enzyme